MLRLANIFTTTIQNLGNAAHTAQSKQVNKPIVSRLFENVPYWTR